MLTDPRQQQQQQQQQRRGLATQTQIISFLCRSELDWHTNNGNSLPCC